MTSAKVWIDRGKSLHERGEYDQAIEAFKRGLNLDPDNDDIMIRIGLSYRYKEEYDTAIEWYGKASI